jgi:hypothetical protein
MPILDTNNVQVVREYLIRTLSTRSFSVTVLGGDDLWGLRLDKVEIEEVNGVLILTIYVIGGMSLPNPIFDPRKDSPQPITRFDTSGTSIRFFYTNEIGSSLGWRELTVD